MKRNIEMHNITILSLSALLVLMISCTQSEVEERGGLSGREVEATFGLNVLSSVPSTSRTLQMTASGCVQTDSLVVKEEELVATRAAADLGTEQESRIQNLWAGQYNKAGTLVKEQYLGELSSQSEVNLRLAESSENHTLYLVANAGDLSGQAGTLNTLLALTRDYGSTDDGLPVTNSCMMTGHWSGTITPGNVSGTVELTRLVAKIRFTYAIGGSGFTFTPSSVKLCSVPAKSRLGEPFGQLSGISYREYSGTVSAEGATVYWYLPENKAGNGDAVDSEKRKTGKGVSNATYVELTGEAVQDGVTYKDVRFRLYPGGNENDYTISRNSYYTISVTLDGIDFSDERISVGVVPPIQNPDNLDAEKSAVKSLQVTSQPGKSWSFMLPDWLSAVVGTTGISAGGTVSYDGPALVTFTAETANPKGESRTASFVIDNQEVTLRQNPSSLTAGNIVSLNAASGSVGNSTFEATAGLPWLATLSSEWGDWLAWQAGALSSGSEAFGSAQPLQVKAASSNPSATSRSGKITVKGGDAIDKEYAGLTGQVTVTQAGSTVTGSTSNVVAEAASNLSATFSATKDLPWEAAVSEGSAWLSLLGTLGSSNTVDGDMKVEFKTASPNPSSAIRTGKITVRVGNASTDANPGPSNTITVNQAGASLAVSGNSTMAATASTATSTFTATAGLSWNVGVVSTGNWLTLTSATNGTNSTTGSAQNITYSAPVNPNATIREGTITVKAGNAIGGTDVGLTSVIRVTQGASEFSVFPASLTLTKEGTSQSVVVTATTGLPWTVSKSSGDSNISVNIGQSEGTKSVSFSAAENKGAVRSAVFTISATGANPVRTLAVKVKQEKAGLPNIVENLQIAPTSTTILINKLNNTACASLNIDGFNDWRLPHIDELKLIYEGNSALEPNYSFSSDIYWSDSYKRSMESICVYCLNFSTGIQVEHWYDSWDTTSQLRKLRCVRDVIKETK